ncbi:transposase [Streptomyces niveus]|uniref:transposase n=1 Tax=Streptomyces niveus TaxID=193462 RepID=UPI0037B8EB73
MQGFLAKAAWDADALRDRVRAVAALAADDAVLIADETGDIKKGTKTAGVQRQCTGTVGRIENAQVGVHLSYGSGRGRTVDWKPRKPRCAGWSRSSNAARSTSISTARCSRPRCSTNSSATVARRRRTRGRTAAVSLATGARWSGSTGPSMVAGRVAGPATSLYAGVAGQGQVVVSGRHAYCGAVGEFPHFVRQDKVRERFRL